jgi:hypothetical protein
MTERGRMPGRIGHVDFPWIEASATGIGSYPGTSPADTLRVVLGEVALPHLPELPGRGPGADLIGRTAGLLVEMPVHLQPSGWRFADRPGLDSQRTRDFWSRDLDALEEQAHAGPLKLQVCGPWTLAASIETRTGNRALRDAGAVRDLIESLAEGVAQHVADVRRRIPGAQILLQVDEPSLPAVLAGEVPTASGFRTLRSVAPPVAEEGLRKVLAAGGAFPLVHCCAPGIPFRLLIDAGARAISVDVAHIPVRGDEVIGEAVEAGVGFFLGVVPGVDSPLPDPAKSAQPVKDLWSRFGFHPEQLARQVVITPVCGLAGASPGYARRALQHCQKAAATLRDNPDE